MTTSTLDNPGVSRLEAAEELLARRKARTSLGGFSSYVDKTYETPPHIARLDDLLEAVDRGEITRLIIQAPPRHGKSKKVSIHFPAYALGRKPDRRIVQSSYAESLSLVHSRAARDLIVSPEYRRLFPHVTHRPETAGQSRVPEAIQTAQEWGTVQGGSYYAVGIGGGLTGRGYHIGIIDDPVKDDLEAQSSTMRDRVHNWYKKVFRTRAEPDAAIIIIMTRWHEDDLVGRLLKEAKENPEADQWVVVNLPAINEEGEALWSDRYPLPELLKIKASVGPRAWISLYQGRPSPEEGAIFKRIWFRRWRELPRFDLIIESWDCAFKDLTTSSFVVGQKWGVSGVDKYLIDQVRGHMTFVETLQAVLSFGAQHPRAHGRLIEDKANGTAVISLLCSRVPGMIAIEPQGGKIVRAHAASPEVAAGNIWIPDDSIAPDWIEEFLSEVLAFPNGMNDDQVDAMTQFINWYRTKTEIPDNVTVIDYDPVEISPV